MKANLFNNKQLPLIMGVVNVTPDSFYDGGLHDSTEKAVNCAVRLAREGADILDVGGESSRPGSEPVDIETEKNRVLPVIEGIREEGIKLPISVDTTKAALASDALESGADIINDISALGFDSEMAATIAENRASVVLMHMQGTPQNMQENPDYDNLIADIISFLKNRIEIALEAGIARENIIVDPGIGFGKSLEHNREIFTSLNSFSGLGVPVLIGHSRKSYLGEVLNRTAEYRLIGTLATSAFLQLEGADILRVHDVKEHFDIRETINWLQNGRD